MTTKATKHPFGYLISVEGIDGSGKTTQIMNILDYLLSMGIDAVSYREPGGAEVGESIRTILKTLSPHKETALLLYYAARVELTHAKIIPALKEGKVVILDRYVDSSYAYQGKLDGLENSILHLNSILPYADKGFLSEFNPTDLTLYLRVSAEVSQERCKLDASKTLATDPHDGLSIKDKQKIIEGYDYLADKNPHRIATIDANQSEALVWESIKQELESIVQIKTHNL